jgi:ABC-type transport system involved in cytochrome c biogenesis permease subunit
MDFSLILGTMLMGIGLLFGALWAKKAWGSFWSFDIKENLAAIAWIAFLIALHFRYVYKKRRTETQNSGSAKLKALSILIIIAYLLLQLCWFGINLLPETFTSLHRY